MAGEPDEPIGLDEARRLYLETDLPVTAIAARLGMSGRGFLAERTRLGWPVRARGLGPQGKRRPPGTVNLVGRLRRQMDRRLVALENAEAPAPAAEYAALLRVLNELTRLEAGTNSVQAPESGENDDCRILDIDAVRETIARRVEGFGAGGDAAPLPVGTPGG